MCIRASICIFFVNYTLFSSFEQLSLCSLLTVATFWILKAPLSEISPTAWPWSAVNRAAQSFYTIWVCGQENLQQYSMSEWSLLCCARRFSLLTLWSLMWQLFDSFNLAWASVTILGSKLIFWGKKLWKNTLYEEEENIMVGIIM